MSGEIYISWERVAENADEIGVKKDEEALRVTVHGLLHMMGERDKSDSDKKKMRKAEENALAVWKCFTWNMGNKEYDVIVVGAGHAGNEAAAAAAQMGCKTLLVTMNMQTIGQMSCNPAMGGVAKGQILREVDAMGGLSGIVSDKTMIQFRMLLPKGPAMWSPRTQNDRWRFAEEWRLA